MEEFMEEKKIIIYDFDGTLTPHPMPNFEMLNKCRLNGIRKNKFYLQVLSKALSKNINFYQAFYETYFEIIRDSGYKVDDINLSLGYENIVYNIGVYEFLCDLQQNNVSNYLVSSGVRVFLDKISIASLFSEIYATTFNYDENNEVSSINYLMSSAKKVDVIKRIISKDNGVIDNCSNVIYIGDGMTDIYAMKYVKDNGGVSICVYDKREKKNIKLRNVASFFAPADFSFDSSLNKYVKKLCNIK